MNRNLKQNLMVTLAALFMTAPAGLGYCGEGTISASYLYTLSNFTGNFSVTWGQLAVDEAVNDVYVLSGRSIKVFNDNGMEIYSINEGHEIGDVASMAVDDEGNIYALVTSDKRYEIVRCNYRGEPLSKIELKNVPAEFAGFIPNTILFRNNSFYLVNNDYMKAIVMDRTGLFKDGYDLAGIIGYTERNRADTGMNGFYVDRQGNMIFTIGATARAYVVSADRKSVRMFGKSGSLPGAFGVPGGVVTDASDKYILVTDILRCRILIFDKNLNFQTEFGYRSLSRDGLIGPLGLAVDSRNRLYVSQLRNRGVSVFQIATGS
jgi:DNA-binding beta-propeller fold protein YncE